MGGQGEKSRSNAKPLQLCVFPPYLLQPLKISSGLRRLYSKTESHCLHPPPNALVYLPPFVIFKDVFVEVIDGAFVMCFLRMNATNLFGHSMVCSYGAMVDLWFILFPLLASASTCSWWFVCGIVTFRP